MNARRTSAHGTTVNVSVDVPNLALGVRFYQEVFGFLEVARPFPSMAVLDANNVTLCILEKAGGTQSAPTTSATRHYDRHWTPVHLDFHVDDIDAALEKIQAHGGVVEKEFRDEGPKPAGFCCDPFGNGFCVIGERVPNR